MVCLKQYGDVLRRIPQRGEPRPRGSGIGSPNRRDQPPLFAIRLSCFPVVFRGDEIGGLRFPQVSVVKDREM
jgi:hypothetical protein